jgi:hypothetical protein
MLIIPLYGRTSTQVHASIQIADFLSVFYLLKVLKFMVESWELTSSFCEDGTGSTGAQRNLNFYTNEPTGCRMGNSINLIRK